MAFSGRKPKVAFISVLSNTTLVILKLIVGMLIGSVSVLSEAIHSGVDLLAAIIAFFSVQKSGKPADENHPFGHGKVENISGTIEALLIFLAAGWIIYEAVGKFLAPEPLEAVGWGVAVMLFSSIVNVIVSGLLFKVGRETDSVALLADAWHLRTDVYTSAGVMFALGVMLVGGRVFPNVRLHWIDPVAAIFVALLILKAAYELTMQASRDLIDSSLPLSEENIIHSSIMNHSAKIIGYHDLKTRKSGSDRFVEFHLVVDSKLSVERSHKITDEISLDIQNRFPGASVTIHVEPCNGECYDGCEHKCELAGSKKRGSGKERLGSAKSAHRRKK